MGCRRKEEREKRKWRDRGEEEAMVSEFYDRDTG